MTASTRSTTRTVLYGIAHCDSVKRARAWLAEHQVAVDFHDFKKAGLPPDRLDAWLRQLGWEALLNRRGTTWRKLDEPERAAVVNAASARALMLRHSSVIRRPVVEWPNGALSVGFDAAQFARQVD